MTRPKLLVLIIALALLGIVFLYFNSNRHLVSEEAEVSLAVETVSAQVTGYVMEVNAQNGQGVAAGDILVRLDPTDYAVALSDAKAVLAAMKQGTPQAVAQSLYASRAGQVDPAELELRLAQARQEELAAKDAVEELSTQAAGATLARRRAEAGNASGLAGLKNSEQTILAQLNAAREKHTTASQFRAQVEQDLEHQKSILRQLDNQAVISEALPAQVDAQAARVRQAELNLANTEILAPADGDVIMRAVEPGQVVSPGQPLMAVVSKAEDQFYVTAVFPAEHDGKAAVELIKPGQYCEISLPEAEGLEFTGRVEHVELSGADLYALSKNNSPATGGPGKISVRVSAHGYNPQTMPPLRPGMKAVVDIDLGRAPEPAAPAPQTPEAPPAPEAGS